MFASNNYLVLIKESCFSSEDKNRVNEVILVCSNNDADHLSGILRASS